MVRQWSTFHPEFAFLPRKFKIAFTGSADSDRAAIRLHDIGIQLVENEDGELGFRVFVGGGMGRTPKVGKLVREFLPRQHLISYLEAILRVYNQLGRRDNIYKARIKILVDALGVSEFSALVEKEWEEIRESSLQVTDAEVERMQAFFAPPAYETLPDSDAAVAGMQAEDTPLGQWARNNVVPHKQSGYSAVVLSLKSYASPSGDLSDKQMEAVADLSEQYGFGEIIVTHTQDLVLPDVRSDALEALFTALVDLDIATPNHNRLTDLICCPGLDFCNLANARSIPVAQEIRQRFDDIDYLDDLGEMSLKISGCINACGHHHVGTIGILGIDKRGEEAYQLMLGGSAGHDASLGKVLGQAFSREEIVPALEKALKTYVKLRESPEETFIETFRRLGDKPFREGVYGA
jgi:sulfite reductase (NADPH) hemoprotein beta-component